MRFIVHISMNV